MQVYINKLKKKEDLTESESKECLEKILTGDGIEDQIETLLKYFSTFLYMSFLMSMLCI